MSDLPQRTSLGNLEYIEIYDYYDFPVFFSCKNTAGQIFISVWVDEDGDGKIWIYAPISEKKFEDLKLGRIDTRSVFASPEDNGVFKVFDKKNTDSEIMFLEKQYVPIEYLPDEGQFIKIVPRTNEIESSAIFDAEKNQKAVFDLHLYEKISPIHQVAAKTLGRVLQVIQENFDSIGQALLKKQTIVGKISSEILRNTQVNATVAFQGSFGIRLIADQDSDMFGNSLASDTFFVLTDLIECENNIEELKLKLAPLHPRAISKFKALLDISYKLQTEIHIAWYTSNETIRGKAIINPTIAESVSNSISEIQTEISARVTIIGTLIGAFLDTRTFKIQDERSGKKYYGEILDEGFADVRLAAFNRLYSAVLLPIIETDALSGEEKIKWKLVALRLVE